MALIDLLMIVGARKRNKLFLIIWMVFAIFDICGRIYLLVISDGSAPTLGIHIGFIVFILISAIFVIRGFFEIKRRERESATGGTFKIGLFE